MSTHGLEKTDVIKSDVYAFKDEIFKEKNPMYILNAGTISLRQYYAGLIMQGLMSAHSGIYRADDVALSFKVADEMIEFEKSELDWCKSPA